MNSMIKLKNLRKNDSIGECDIFPEDSRKAGHIVVNLNSEELEEISLPKGYEWCKNHAYHAAKNLVTLLKMDDIPEEYLVMWY